MKGSTIRSKRQVWAPVCTILVLVGIWQALSLSLPSILVPSPLETLMAFIKMMQSGELLQQLIQSISRMLTGFVIGMVIAIVCGLIAGNFPSVYEAFRPILSLLLGIPPIIVVVLAMVWFGTGSIIPIFVVSVLVFPSIYLNTADGWRNIDRQLLEMAKVYKCSAFHTLRHIILPGLAVPIFTAISLATGSAVRITIMAELLGSDEGIGYSLALARVNIDTAKVFAWTLISILLISLIDNLVIHPLKKATLRWNTEE
ncbi:ABC transporter permease [Brevibacillus sp. SYSU BS000544]|uniref:ABC transporter permease n=1 Tax=Brevibacillus sp. SYSU BS000544 TaxID=3416443 RepID=UPI003CE5488C